MYQHKEYRNNSDYGSIASVIVELQIQAVQRGVRLGFFLPQKSGVAADGNGFLGISCTWKGLNVLGKQLPHHVCFG